MASPVIRPVPRTRKEALGYEVRQALHELWTRHVGQPDYIKGDWGRLSNAIENLLREIEE